MKVFIIGITGAVGGLLASNLLSRGDSVRGLVRSADKQRELAGLGIDASIGELADLSAGQLAELIAGADWVVYTAGSNGGAREITRTIDGEGVVKAIEATRSSGVEHFALVSVLPESWRERELDEEVEYYFAVKKQADVAVSRSGLNWLILRPSLLLDDSGTGLVSLGPAELHDDITREDVAATLAQLLHEPHISRQILEVNRGTTPIQEAVSANVRGCFVSHNQPD